MEGRIDHPPNGSRRPGRGALVGAGHFPPLELGWGLTAPWNGVVWCPLDYAVGASGRLMGPRVPTSCYPHVSESWGRLFPPRPNASRTPSLIAAVPPTQHTNSPCPSWEGDLPQKKGPGSLVGPLCSLASAQLILVQSSKSWPLHLGGHPQYQWMCPHLHPNSFFVSVSYKSF